MNYYKSTYSILIDDKLSSGEKVLLLFILETTFKEKKPFKLSNKEISEVLNKNKMTISGNISRLSEKGYVDVKYSLDYKEIDCRVITFSKLQKEERDILFQNDDKEYYTTKQLNEIRKKRTEEYDNRLTDIGYVYLIKSKYGYKIGKSKKVQDRLSLFNVKLPFKIDIIGFYKVKNMSKMETFLHKKYKDVRLEGEWFNLSEKEKKEVVQTLIDGQLL